MPIIKERSEVFHKSGERGLRKRLHRTGIMPEEARCYVTSAAQSKTIIKDSAPQPEKKEVYTLQ